MKILVVVIGFVFFGLAYGKSYDQNYYGYSNYYDGYSSSYGSQPNIYYGDHPDDNIDYGDDIDQKPTLTDDFDEKPILPDTSNSIYHDDGCEWKKFVILML